MPEAVAMRERLFTMRMNDDEYDRLQRVADKYGLSLVAAVRMLVKREADAIGVPPPANTNQRKPRKRK
jgi:antitoxin component of RelBE/YafQ-DinJ toxin-antitoxin module